MRKEKESNDYIYLIILTTFAVLSFSTFIHDPILHGVVAKFNGWQISDYTTGLMTGQTTAITTVSQATSASTLDFWLFYMFPPIFIYIITLIVVVIRPDRLIIVAGRIMLALNLASFNPSISGSDAANAIQFLLTRGWTEFNAYALHFLVMGLAITIWGIYEYIGTENNPADAKARAKNVVD